MNFVKANKSRFRVDLLCKKWYNSDVQGNRRGFVVHLTDDREQNRRFGGMEIL